MLRIRRHMCSDEIPLGSKVVKQFKQVRNLQLLIVSACNAALLDEGRRHHHPIRVIYRGGRSRSTVWEQILNFKHSEQVALRL
jgi:hypothetical protein